MVPQLINFKYIGVIKIETENIGVKNNNSMQIDMKKTKFYLA